MDPDEPYRGQVSRPHLDASVSALEELAGLVTTTGEADPSRTLRLRLGHLDHGGFLTHLLHGFPIPQIRPDGLISTGDGTAEVMYAIIINQTLEVQLRTALASVASYLARQAIIRRVLASDQDATNLDQLVADMDAQAELSLDDALRVHDWRAAAVDIRERAIAADVSLRVRFSSPLLDADEVRRRVPVMRHVYNQVAIAREAIDRVAAALSVGLTVGGDGASEAALTAAREILDVGEVRRYSAHVARDAFVCGNGFLEIQPPPASVRLLRPEDVEVGAGMRFSAADPATGMTSSIGGHVLHLKGGHQTRGLLGVSILEPFVMILAQLEVAERVVTEGVPIAIQHGTEEARAWAARTEAFAARTQATSDERMRELLGGGTGGLAQPPPDLYFPGHAEMTPAAPSLRFVDGDNAT